MPWDIPWDIPWDMPWDIPWDIPRDVPWDVPLDITWEIPWDTPLAILWDIPWDIPWGIPWDILYFPNSDSFRVLVGFKGKPCTVGCCECGWGLPGPLTRQFPEGFSPAPFVVHEFVLREH